MNIQPRRLKASRFFGAFVVLAAATAGISTAQAADRIFNLHLYNADYKPVTFTIMPGGSNCYEGSPGLGEKFANIAPGQAVTITIARVQGHGCNGKNGVFGVEFDPGVGHRNIQYFAFSNDGGMWLHPTTNGYPGTLSAKGAYPRNVRWTAAQQNKPLNASYTYSTFARPKPVAGRPVGEWQLICQGYCNETVSKEISNSTTKEKSHSSETTEAVSIALEAGLDFPGGGSAKTTMTASQEKKVGQSMSDSISRGETNTKGKNIVFTVTEMRELGIFAVWQWIAKTTVRTGAQVEQIVVTTDKITCTGDASAPTYLPGSAPDITACSGGLAEARKAAERAAEQQAAAQKAAQDQAAAQQAAAQKAAADRLAAQQATAQQAAAQQAAQQQAAQQLAAQQQAIQQASQQLAALQKATKELAAQQQAARLTAPTPAAAAVPAAAPTISGANTDVAPPASAVSIWIPPTWGKKNAPLFDMSVGDPGDEVQVGFKFMNANAAAAQTKNVIDGLTTAFGNLVPQGDTSRVQLGGMPAEMREFKGKVNSPGNALHGKTVDVAMALVQAPRNQIVGLFAIGVADTSDKHQADVIKILQGLKPR